MIHFLWRIELFGSLRLIAGDDAAAVERFQTRKTASLLAYLAFHRGRIITRDLLADQFWPDADPSDARNSLRVALASLRRQLEPPGVPSGAILVADRNTVRLAANAFTTDVAEFEEIVKAERRLEADTSGGHGDERLALLLRAVALYRGPLLSGWYDEWIDAEQARLAVSLATVLRRLVRVLIARRDNERALFYARQITQMDPLDEEAHRTLMRLHMARGRLDEARAQWRTLESALRNQLGVTPSQASRDLADQLHLNVVAPPQPENDKGERIKDRKADAKETSEREAQPTLASSDSPLSLIPYPLSVPAAGGSGGGGGLPLQFTRLWGREAEMTALAPLLRPVSDAEAEEARRAPVGDALFVAGDPRTRLVTLTGPGGTGKTRLAAELGARLRPDYGNNVWFAPLASVTDPQLLGRALADALRVPPPPPGESASPLDSVVRALNGDADDGPPVLLILDNAEQIAASVARLVRILLVRVPRLVCLVTSRQQLDLSGEYEFAVAPLPLPPRSERAPDALSRYPSVRLFVDRAQSLRPDFQITARNAGAIAELCRRLDGLPLALELAAAWARLLTPAQMLDRLGAEGEASETLLTSDKRVLPERHRSLRTVMDESYRLLSPPAQQAFAGLSVFRGGWTARAAAAVLNNSGGAARAAAADNDNVAEASGVPRNDMQTLEWMRLLSQHSLVRTEEDRANDDLRFSLLETVREYAATKLTGDAFCARANAHAQFFAQLARVNAAGLVGPLADNCLAALDREQDNLRAALQWTLRPAPPSGDDGADGSPSAEANGDTESDNAPFAPDTEMGLRLAASLWRFWYARGQGDEGSRWLMRALLAVPPTPHKNRELRDTGTALALRGEALLGAGRLAARRGDILEACGFLEEALGAFRAVGDDAKIAVAAMNLGSVARERGDAPLAQRAMADALEATRRAAPFDLWTIAALLIEAGEAALAAGAASAAIAFLRDAAELRDLLCDRWGAAEARLLLAQALENDASISAPVDEAELLRAGSEMVLDALGGDHDIASSFLRLGYIAQGQGDLPAARGLFADSVSAFQAVGAGAPPPPRSGGVSAITEITDGGEVDGTVLAATAFGMAAWRQNDTEAARTAFASGASLRREARARSGAEGNAPLALALLPVAALAASAAVTRSAARSALRECIELCCSEADAPGTSGDKGGASSLDRIAFFAMRLVETMERDAGLTDAADRAERIGRLTQTDPQNWRSHVTADFWR